MLQNNRASLRLLKGLAAPKGLISIYVAITHPESLMLTETKDLSLIQKRLDYPLYFYFLRISEGKLLIPSFDKYNMYIYAVSNAFLIDASYISRYFV